MPKSKTPNKVQGFITKINLLHNDIVDCNDHAELQTKQKEFIVLRNTIQSATNFGQRIRPRGVGPLDNKVSALEKLLLAKFKEVGIKPSNELKQLPPREKKKQEAELKKASKPERVAKREAINKEKAEREARVEKMTAHLMQEPAPLDQTPVEINTVREKELEPFYQSLLELSKKMAEFKDKTANPKDTKYIDAYNAVSGLYKELVTYYTQYVQDEIIDRDRFNVGCQVSITKYKPELEKHRGIKETISNLPIIGYLYRTIGAKLRPGKFFDDQHGKPQPKTDSQEKVEELENALGLRKP